VSFSLEVAMTDTNWVLLMVEQQQVKC